MKKLSLLVIILLAFTLVACGQSGVSENTTVSFTGVIEEIYDDTAIVIPNDDQVDILASGDRVSVNLSAFEDELAVGDEIKVYYTGEIMESYPLQINVIDIEKT